MLGPLVAVLAGCNNVLAPSGVDANWRLHDSAHFTLYARPSTFADSSASTLAVVLEDQLAATTRVLGVSYADTISVFLYPSGADAGLPSDHAGVAYATTAAVRAVCVPPLDGNLFGLLSHEANHVIERNTLGRPGTSFMSEGLASATMSETFHANGPTFFHAWVAERLSQVPGIDALADDDRWNDVPESLAYNASASFLAFVLERYGAAPIRRLYVVPSSDFPGQFAVIVGQPLGAVEVEWRAFLAGR